MSAVDCAQHRPYLAAIADGETELVPGGTREHVRGCSDCTAELSAHRLLGSRLRDAAQAEALQPVAPPWRSRLVTRRLAPLALAAATAIAVAALEITHLSPAVDPALAAAVQVAGRAPQYQSSDPADIAAWCSAKYGNRVPMVAVTGLQPEGARMDWPNDVGVATVTYQLGGRTVHVSWLAKSLGSTVPSESVVNGQPAVYVQAHGITAVITGSAPEAELVQVAREIAA